jgi:hypothetical protein
MGGKLQFYPVAAIVGKGPSNASILFCPIEMNRGKDAPMPKWSLVAQMPFCHSAMTQDTDFVTAAFFACAFLA